LCRAWAVTPRLTRAMADLLPESSWLPAAAKRRRRWSAVGHEILFDVVAVSLEQHARAAQLADLLVGALDHAMALVRVRRHHFSGAGDPEALLGARLGLHLGHLALLSRPTRKTRVRRTVARNGAC